MTDEIRLERICFPVTLRCNLKCKLCAERSPYYEKPYHPDLSELIKEIDLLFDLVDFIEKFDICGGEPFLRNDLGVIINHLFFNYRKKIEKARITTNGTILPTDDFLLAAKKWGDSFFVIVDRYSVSTKYETVAEQLKAADIPFEVRDYTVDLHCNGWVDYGDFSIKHEGISTQKQFNECLIPRLGFFTALVNGKLFPCAKSRLLFEEGITKTYVDCFDDSLTVDIKRTLFSEQLSRTVLESCKYCNGLCEDSERFMPAEQLK